jgi:hypothetical protein
MPGDGFLRRGRVSNVGPNGDSKSIPLAWASNLVVVPRVRCSAHGGLHEQSKVTNWFDRSARTMISQKNYFPPETRSLHQGLWYEQNLLADVGSDNGSWRGEEGCSAADPEIHFGLADKELAHPRPQ